MTKTVGTLPFLFGAQFYRAPTPDRALWADDLRRMADAGFNQVKVFGQWRWAHRKPQEFFFADLDELFDLAAAENLAVTVNLLFDVAPSWLYRQYPDCKMVCADGRVLESRAVVCRQIGGYPGPCFNHPQAWAAREQFLREIVARYAHHPAMGMWDVWNEPESCLFLRRPEAGTLLCYCDNCRGAFVRWLAAKYGSIDRLNDVWGRCYADYIDVELPRDPQTLGDMVDWRLFHLDTITAEARRRMEAAKSIDSEHPVYLHPVPNTMDPFNAITGCDDFALGALGDCFGGTVNGLPSNPLQAVSAAAGKVCYNVESHLRAGATGIYPRMLSRQDLANAFLPQIAMGVRGFLFWQYRCETLGAESPGWGLLDPDGRAGVTHQAAVEFWHRLRRVAPRLMEAPVESPEVAIFKSNANEIFHWCVDGNLARLADSVEGFTQLLYEMNVRLAYVDDRMTRAGLTPSIKVLVLPAVWALDQATVDAIVEWVRRGGTLVCEGLTGSFDLTRGRHSRNVPGLGMSDAFGFEEVNATAVRHLAVCERDSDAGHGANLSADLAKALKAMGNSGGDAVQIMLSSGSTFRGRTHYAELEGDSLAALAGVPGRAACVVFKKVGHGGVFYAGTELGWQGGASRPAALREFMQRVLAQADVTNAAVAPDGISGGANTLRVDRLATGDGDAIVVFNFGNQPMRFAPDVAEPFAGIFSDARLARETGFSSMINSQSTEFFVPERWLAAARRPARDSVPDRPKRATRPGGPK